MDERNFPVELSAIQPPSKIKAQATAEWVMMRHICNVFTFGISWISFIHLLKLNDNLTLFNHTMNSSALCDCSRLLCAHNLKLSEANFKCTYISANCVHTAAERRRRCRRCVFNRSCWMKAVKITTHHEWNSFMSFINSELFPAKKMCVVVEVLFHTVYEPCVFDGWTCLCCCK